MSGKIIGYTSQWVPQPGPQRALWNCPIEHILFAGSRGGGKSDALIAMWLRHLEVNEAKEKGLSSHCRGLILRRTYDELTDLIERAQEIYGSQAKYWSSTRTFEFPNNARIQFSYLDRDAHARRFQGRAFTFQGIEEAGEFPSPTPLDKVFGSLRSKYAIKKQIILTANPGGVGHSWLKKRYVDPAPIGNKIIENPIKLLDGSVVKKKKIYIPSKTSDNKIMLANNPDYEAQLVESTRGLPHLYKAWILGSWDIVAGGYFDSIWDPEVHVLPAIPSAHIPRGWQIYRSYDWGSARPFSLGWWAKTDGYPFTMPDGTQKRMARGSLIRLAEWYGEDPNEEKTNVGLSMLERDIAERARQMEDALFPEHEVQKGVADHNIFIPDQAGRRDYDEWRKRGMKFAPADKERIAGWRRIAERLTAAKEARPETPAMYICENCHAALRFLPVAPRDPNFPDEILPGFEDHVLDEIRYMASFRAKQGISYTQVAL